MIKILLSSCFFILSLHGGVIDDYYVTKAGSEIKKKNYQEALEFYQKVKEKTDQINYNMGNLYYKLEQYQKALEYYIKIQDETLQHSKYHNMANCYSKLLQYDNAVKYNQKALEYKEDQKTKYNLQLSQMIQKKLLQQEETKDKKDNTLHKVGTSLVVDEANFFDESKFSDDELPDRENEQIQKSGNLSNSAPIEQDENIMIKDDIKEDTLVSSEKLELNNYLQQKWDNKLNKVKIYTLLIPLEKGVVNDSKTPW